MELTPATDRILQFIQGGAAAGRSLRAIQAHAQGTLTDNELQTALEQWLSAGTLGFGLDAAAGEAGLRVLAAQHLVAPAEPAALDAIEAHLLNKDDGSRMSIGAAEEAPRLMQALQHRHSVETLCCALLGLARSGVLYAVVRISSRQNVEPYVCVRLNTPSIGAPCRFTALCSDGPDRFVCVEVRAGTGEVAVQRILAAKEQLGLKQPVARMVQQGRCAPVFVSGATPETLTLP